MQGKTHLVFGTAMGLLALAAVSLSSHHTLVEVRGVLDPQGPPATIGWLPAALAAAVGGLLPDIDQPGSLITRLPVRQTRVAAAAMGRSPLARLPATVLLSGGGLAGVLLGDRPGGGGWGRRAMFWLLGLACAAAMVALRWARLPPLPLFSAPLRSALVPALAVAGIAAFVAAAGGLAGLIHRLPGHHRGWTHAPPFALLMAGLAWLASASLAPALPGLGLAFAVGYLSHLTSDALTVRGIPLWWPGEGRPSLHLLPRPLRVRTGGTGEAVFNFVWVPAAVALSWFLFAR